MGRILIEACVESVEDAVGAYECGADRIEFNRALDRDGLTPSTADVEQVVRSIDVPVVAMLRPHDRDYVYTEEEFAKLERGVAPLLATGCAGIAVGVLNPDRTIDASRMTRLAQRASTGTLVFHRAFDQVVDPMAALDLLIELGVDRVLTSGLQPTALAGSGMIRRLIERAAGRIEVLPGAGVGPGNVRSLVQLTGCSQVHGSFRDIDGRFSAQALLRSRAALDAKIGC